MSTIPLISTQQPHYNRSTQLLLISCKLNCVSFEYRSTVLILLLLRLLQQFKYIDFPVTPQGLATNFCYPSTANSKNEETKIQEAVTLNTRSGCPKLIRWIHGSRKPPCQKFERKTIVTSTVATHVLQVMCVGYTGLRFPVCHYPTCGLKASELHTIIWSTIKMPHDWCFLVDYIIQDRGRREVNS